MSRIIRGNQVDPRLLKEAAFEEGRALGISEGRAEAGALLVRAQADVTLQRQQANELAAQLAIELASAVLGELALTDGSIFYINQEHRLETGT